METNDYVVTNKVFNCKVRELKRKKGRVISEENPKILNHQYEDAINELVLTGYWNAKMSKVFDIIHSILVKRYWVNSLGQIPNMKNKDTSQMLIKKYYNLIYDDDDTTLLNFKIDYHQFKKTKLFEDYSKITFTNIIKDIQKTKFTINNFMILGKEQVTKKDNIKPLPIYVNINPPVSLIEDFKVDMVAYGHSKNANVPVYNITFSKFWRFIFMNSLLLSVDWIPIKIYNLSVNAQFLYKRYVVHKQQKKTFEVSYFDLQGFLDISGGLAMTSDYIMNALEELKQVEVVSDYEQIGKRAISKFYKITRSEKDHF